MAAEDSVLLVVGGAVAAAVTAEQVGGGELLEVDVGVFGLHKSNYKPSVKLIAHCHTPTPSSSMIFLSMTSAVQQPLLISPISK